MNKGALIGRFVDDPVFKKHDSDDTKDRAWCRFAVDKSLSKEQKQKMKDTGKNTADFISVTYWGSRARAIANNCKKGKRVYAEYRLQSTFNEEHNPSFGLECIGTMIEFLDNPKGVSAPDQALKSQLDKITGALKDLGVDVDALSEKEEVPAEASTEEAPV